MNVNITGKHVKIRAQAIREQGQSGKVIVVSLPEKGAEATIWVVLDKERTPKHFLRKDVAIRRKERHQ